jgi:hypothetical protein
VVGAAVVVATGGVVAAVVRAMVVVGGCVVGAGVAGAVVCAVVAWVVVGAGLEGDAHPAAMTARSMIAPRIAGPVRDGFMLMEIPHGMITRNV